MTSNLQKQHQYLREDGKSQIDSLEVQKGRMTAQDGLITQVFQRQKELQQCFVSSVMEDVQELITMKMSALTENTTCSFQQWKDSYGGLCAGQSTLENDARRCHDGEKKGRESFTSHG